MTVTKTFITFTKEYVQPGSYISECFFKEIAMRVRSFTLSVVIVFMLFGVSFNGFAQTTPEGDKNIVKKDIGEAVVSEIKLSLRPAYLDLLASSDLASWSDIKNRLEAVQKVTEAFVAKYANDLTGEGGGAPAVTQTPTAPISSPAPEVVTPVLSVPETTTPPVAPIATSTPAAVVPPTQPTAVPAAVAPVEPTPAPVVLPATDVSAAQPPVVTPDVVIQPFPVAEPVPAVVPSTSAPVAVSIIPSSIPEPTLAVVPVAPVQSEQAPVVIPVAPVAASVPVAPVATPPAPVTTPAVPAPTASVPASALPPVAGVAGGMPMA